MVHVSRNPVLVPVFTAAGNGTSNGVTPPNPGMRASGSLRMSLTRYACHRERLREHALRAERSEGVRQVDESHLAAPEREGEAVALDAVERRQTEAMADLEHRVEPDRVECSHGGHVER